MMCKKCGKKASANGRYCPHCGTDQLTASVTLREIYGTWERSHKRGIKPKTMEGYRDAWKHLSALASQPASSLELADFQSALDKMLPTSKSNQQKVKILIALLYRHGLLVGGGLRLDFAPHLYLDGYAPHETPIFQDREITALIEYANNPSNCLFQAARVTLCLIFTGLRPNEFFDLAREDINLREGYLIAKGSKTQAGKGRLIPIVNTIRLYLMEWYLQTKSGGDFLLHRLQGERYDLHNWREREFYPLMLELGINTPKQKTEQRRKPYSCRHTFASLGCRAEIDHEILEKMIGHTDWKFTAKTYVHAQIEQFKKEADKIQHLASNFIIVTDSEREAIL